MTAPVTSSVLALAALAPLPAQESGPEPVGVGQRYAPGAEALWTLEQRGKPLGHCASRYEGEVALASLRAHLFREQVELELELPTGPLVQRFTLEHWCDDAGHPLRFELRSQVADVKTGVTGVFAGGKAELVVHQGPSEQRLTVDSPPGAFLLANNFVSQLELLLSVAPVPAEGARHTLFSASTLQTFPLALKRTGTTPEGATLLEDSLGERLHFTPGLELARVEIPAQGVVILRTDEPVERFDIQLTTRARPADLEHEDVTISDGAVSLAGTVTRPKGQQGPFPAVFFLSGSGPQDRDGFALGLDLGTHEILDRLTREGFLVLRVDDRGVGASTGPTDDLTLDDLVEDGRRAVRHLLARPDVDPGRVALLGHSEGGVSAPLLAASEPIAAVVLLAAPGRPIDALLREQLLFGRELGGARPEALEAFGQEVDAFLARIARGEPIAAEGLAPELAAFLPSRAWLASHVGRDPLPPLAALRCPVLVLQGGRDVQVSAERDTPPLAAALAAAGHADHELRVFPELDHLFKRASERASELDYLKSRPVDPEFLDVLSSWLKARLMR
jgi:pimeloyl-ACP methyl ester carboxylesterase